MGYVRLNEYMKKRNLCQCGVVVSKTLYWIVLNMKMGEQMRRNSRMLFEACGVTHLDLNILLYAKHDDDTKTREVIY